LNLGDDRKFVEHALPLDRALVLFNSEGGSLPAGLGIGRAIRLKGFSTWVPSDAICASACGLAWLGGQTRLSGKTARIGFHAVSEIEKGTAKISSAGNAITGAYLNGLGLSEKAIFAITSAAPEHMTWVTPANAERLGILMKVFDLPSPSETKPAPTLPPVPPAAFLDADVSTEPKPKALPPDSSPPRKLASVDPPPASVLRP
jgi:hypothetical protein